MKYVFGSLAAAAALLGQCLAATVLYYTSTPFAIGGGQTETLDQTAGYNFFQVQSAPPNLLSFSINNFSPSVPPLSFYSLELASDGSYSMPLAAGLYTGVSYGYGTQDFGPYLNFAARGSGTGSAGGYFNILDLQYSLSGIVSVLAVDFLQTNPFVPGAHTWGSFRLNSSIPITTTPILDPTSEVPLPAAAWIFAAGLASIPLVKRRKQTA